MLASETPDEDTPSTILPRWVEDIGGTIDRARYRLQQQSLALSLGIGGRLWSLVLSPRQGRPSRQAVAELVRRYEALLERDLENVVQGYYPRDLLYQLPVFQYVRLLPHAITEIPRFIWRSYQRRYDDLPVHINRDDYPPYYLRTFHWQSDGWLSERSAKLYDASVEILFGGTADVMRRMAIPPLVDALRERARPRILDVGCGTGRFLLQVARALPHAKLYGLDLSPHYVKHARAVLAPVPGASLLTENAESMPFANEAFDAVTSVFLFHELPSDARRTVMREVARVLKPGGVFVVCDAAQLSDSADLAHFLYAFQATYHEPYFKGYVRDDLAEVMRECGFGPLLSEPHLVSKVVAGRKQPHASRRKRIRGRDCR